MANKEDKKNIAQSTKENKQTNTKTNKQTNTLLNKCKYLLWSLTLFHLRGNNHHQETQHCFIKIQATKSFIVFIFRRSLKTIKPIIAGRPLLCYQYTAKLRTLV